MTRKCRDKTRIVYVIVVIAGRCYCRYSDGRSVGRSGHIGDSSCPGRLSYKDWSLVYHQREKQDSNS